MAQRQSELIQSRLDKLQRIRGRGIDPYPARYHRSHTTQEAVALYQEAEDGSGGLPQVKLAGRITAMRSMGKAIFLDLKDGSGKVQVYLRRDALGEEKYSLLQDFDIGDFIGVEGQVFKTRTGEVTIRASDLTMLSKSLQPLPEKWHGLADVEKRYRQRYLDLLSNDQVRRTFEVRGQAISAMRRFLEERGFIEVETPVLQSLAAGALARPFATHHHALDRELYLRIATELHLKRLIIGGFDRVYEIGRIFRNEGISTKHNPEFTTMESYQAYADYLDVMEMVEQMVSFIAREVLGTMRIGHGEMTVDLSPPWRRLTLCDAIKERSGIDFEAFPDARSLEAGIRETGLSVDDGLNWGKLVDFLLSHTVEPHLIQPTFLLDYPVELSPLAKRKPGSERLVERFEAFAGGMEIANAFSEINDPLEQRERFREQDRMRALFGDEEAERIDEDFLLALEHGMPPTGGLGVGVDRLVMLLTNQQSIREVILFPQLRAVHG
ncbi:lysine--tRNA ligase [Dehalococcoidia bacterium]|nr:lysine--tRNA ligase [Dehalococcoidia bacterium]MCL0079517.1 lysine--tRNA ligase [Dehalococcoidia bacterium]MCL0089780.1 lysine--tRNA ligase [Dehalococcoidia bacterium]MCL0094119.1 lysine--tRNA ligase [Dehalococcoidia bacterium]MCL0098127.1 lysine--tRNA ligase [Dehalococcoidia bacterium]